MRDHMTSTPLKVSIVIPAHNEEKNLARTLEAVLALDYPEFEVIVVDNASTDATKDVAARFPVILVMEPRKGLLYARERGRQEANGEIIANVDADCLPDEDWLANGIGHFEDPHVAAVSGPYDYFDGKPIFRAVSLFVQKYIFWSMNMFLRLLRKGGIVIGGNTLIRAAALEAVGGYDTSILFYGEDTDTAKRVSKRGLIAYDTEFIMKTSARRFASQGVVQLTSTYFFHFFKVIFSPKK
jgi:cellulose synthase/poly-beta-1,6-N-acetylglucosamine synthase-like glycosyltransferase